MALFRCGSGSTKNPVLYSGIRVTSQHTMPYDGNSGIFVASYYQEVTEATCALSYTKAQVLASSQNAPFWSHSYGNQGGKLYYNNGNIVYEATAQNGTISLTVVAIP